MTRGSFRLFSAAIVCAAAVSISISSCDSNNNPTTPSNNGGVDQSKGPEVLAGEGRRAVAVTEAPFGGASFRYDEDWNLIVAGLDGEQGSGVVAEFGKPIGVWHNSVDATFGDNGSLAFEAKDDAGITEARVDLQVRGDGAIAFPTFTSHPKGGDPLYDVYIYNNGGLVGSQIDVDADRAVNIYYPQSCTLKLASADWSVAQVSSQCVWRFGLNPCCTYQFQLPDGRILDGNEIKFVEKNTKGVYVYLQTKRVITTGTAVNLTSKASIAFSASL